MKISTCIDKPLSWLLLEQYHLNELPSEDQKRVKNHLANCNDCKYSLKSIQNDTYKLLPLPNLKPEPKLGFGFGLKKLNHLVSFIQSAFLKLENNWMFGVAAVVTAIVLAIVIMPFLTSTSHQMPLNSITFKGGDLAVSLTRQRRGNIVANPVGFKNGDVFSIKLTCPEPDFVKWDVVVFQDGEVFFPYSKRLPINCGNNRSLLGAFKLSGNSSATICVMIDDLPLREDVKKKGKYALPEGTVCETLEYLSSY